MVNNMKKIFLWLVTLMFLGSGLAYAGPYTDSAHGNATNGVDRKSPFPDYAVGNCAHCHEQHAMIGGAEPAPSSGTSPPTASKFCLFANNFDTTATTGAYLQDDNACFYCHYGTGAYQTTPFSNYSYSITFGGNTDTTPVTIFDSFNSTSYHNLKDVIDWASDAIDGWPSTFTAGSNPCSACHNVHIAQRSCGKPTGSYDPTKSAISRPSDHGNLWGDDDGTVNPSERMDTYSSDTYQSPYYYAATPTNYEPANNTTSDGSNLPNYATFCLDCHVNAVEKGAGTLTAINWTTSGGDNHGQKGAGSGGSHGELIAPYANASSGIYALSCTDCHEPHGSSNEWLLRTEVNAKSGIEITSTGVWYEFCTACHSVNLTSGSHSSLTSSSSCTGSLCHAHGDKF
jgi:cytochrome c553